MCRRSVGLAIFWEETMFTAVQRDDIDSFACIDDQHVPARWKPGKVLTGEAFLEHGMSHGKRELLGCSQEAGTQPPYKAPKRLSVPRLAQP